MFGGGGGDHDDGNGGGFGRGAGRIFAPGDLRLLLLVLIGKQPSYGYELIKAIEQQFGGAYAPSPGSVYPNLTLLEELGHVRGAADADGRTKYEITAGGRDYLRANEAQVDAVESRTAIAARALAGRRAPREIVEAMSTLRATLGFHRGTWTPVEVRRVRAILMRAAAEIEADPAQPPPAR